MVQDYQIRQFKKNVFNKRSSSDLSEEQIEMTASDVFAYMRDDLFKVEIMPVDPDTGRANDYYYDSFEVMEILNIRYAQYIKRFSKYKPETIAINISEATLAELEEKRDIFPGVSIEESPFRVYNDAPYFAHIIGYTRDISAEKLEVMAPLGYDADDQVGFVGIEKEMEEYLRGYDGHQEVEVNNLGRTMKVLEEVLPVMGNDVYLTIDRDLQIETYHILEKQMAEILVDKMYMRYPKADDTRFVLLKDVYDSIFRYELIDVDHLDISGSDSGKEIYDQVTEIKEEMSTSVMDEISGGTLPVRYASNYPVYNYVFDQLKLREYLDSRFYRSDYYDLFTDRKISFDQLIQVLYEDGLLVIPLEEGDVIYAKVPEVDEEEENPVLATDFDVDETLTAAVHEIVIDGILEQQSLRKWLYLYAIDQEMFDYRTLTKLIVEVGLVSATEQQMSDIERSRLSPLSFMKEKVLNIEITPQELALDPSSGSVVITDVDTGEILALVSYPTYDNSRLVNQFDGGYYNEQRLDPTRPLFPRATMSKTVPGSTLKMLMGLAALEEEVISVNERINATGYFNKIFPAAKCWIYDKNHTGHGPINVVGALEESCNYFFYEMGYRLGITDTGRYDANLGITRIQDYIAWVGLDAKTGIEIGETTSDLPKKDPVRAAIGQEQNNYTPVQLARYMNVLANDGEMRELNLVDKVMTKEGEVIVDFTPAVLRENTFQQDHIDAIKEGMLAVTQGGSGTARSYFYDVDLDIAGKTGTAEIVTYDEKSQDPVRSIVKRPNHAVFTGFAPYDDPEVSVVSVIQFAYSSKYAALNSKEVFKNYFDLERQREDLFTDHHLE